MSKLLPDSQLPDLENFQKGYQDEFELFFKMNHAALIRFACSLIINRQEAEDIVMEAFIKCWEKRQDFPSFILIRAFLYTTVKYNCFNYLRTREKRLVKNLKYLEIQEINWKAQSERDELLVKYYQKLNELVIYLSPKQREVFIARVCLMKSYEEIAVELNISIANAQVLFHQAKKRIIQILGTT